jgi:segregation and condensation protein A
MSDHMSPAKNESLRGEAIAEWEDPPRGGKKGAAPVLAVDGFAAPLDWLLDRVTAQKIDLAKLSILALVEAFVCALEAALPAGSPAGPEGAPSGIVGRNGGAGAKLGEWGDWLVMAATLAWLRSKLLLPPDTREARAAAQEAEALRQKLLRRVAMGEVADWLERRPLLGHDVFLARIGAEPEEIARGADTTDLLRSCLAVLKLGLPADSYRPPERRECLNRHAGDARRHHGAPNAR